MNKFVIKIDSTWKRIFDILLLLLAVWNIFSNAYFTAFGIPNDKVITMIDNFVEVFFYCDMVFNFCQEYLDEETYTIVSDFKLIAKHYIKKTFIIDLLACLPITLFETIYLIFESNEVRLFRMLKLLRLPRLAELLNVEKFKSLINEYYQGQLERRLKEG
jgi:hypothetical protein